MSSFTLSVFVRHCNLYESLLGKNNSKTVSKKLLSSFRLAEIGKLEHPRIDSAYTSGQLFLHNVLGYRGVVLFSWETKVFDRDAGKEKPKITPLTVKKAYSAGPTNQFYYQALIDERDWNSVRLTVDNVAYLGLKNQQELLGQVLSGCDYVSHNDIVPYSSSESVAIQHSMFDRFFNQHNKGSNFFVSNDLLRLWQNDNTRLLKSVNVYKETTNDIRVTAMPFYLGFQSDRPETVYWWRYCIRLETFSKMACILRDREWKVQTESGSLETIRGRGVLAMEPVLSRSLNAFQYSSHVSMKSPSGFMWGHYKMENESGQHFKVNVPPFYLLSKQEQESLPNNVSSM